ncbi:hypothetical protein B0J12DRAFT_683641 [Macrophomina phaseolina]|uniref:Uncharacterized protein n=1 Tax=Macrophomina phaseolina TaxID=35725 RepID=A0ABQ8FW22_9PEZI|nr:hypothetical protein B0J12DRAFT_683641 [Macrophomina phaseolina]
MASASAIASEDCHFSPGAPTVVQWVSSNGATQSIGTKPTHPVFAFIITHISPETAFFGLRTHIGLKEGGKTKTTINVFIYPEHITHLALKDPDSHPVPVLNAFTSRIPQYKSPEDIVGLTFSLQRPATAVGPSNATRLSPKTKPSEDFLISLNSLVQATEVTMFIPKNNNHVGRIKSLCIKACNGGLKASPYEYSLPRLYSGSGGKDIRDLLSRFREPSEGPPSYDELALSSPAPPPLRRGRRKREYILIP